MKTIKIAWAEDNIQLQRLYVNAVGQYDELKLVAVARSGDELILKLNRLAAEDRPDVIMMDIEMPGMNGIEATRRATALLPGVKVIMFTVFEDAENLFMAIQAGASGYLLKDASMQRIVDTIKEVAEGELHLSSLMASTLLQRIRQDWTPDMIDKTDDKTPISEFQLTGREIEILGMLVDGHTYSVIADKIFISPSTVRKHIENIYTKLHVNSKAQAIQISYKNNWFSPNK